MIRFERLRGIHVVIFTWVQYQIGTLTFINIVLKLIDWKLKTVSLIFLKTKFQNQEKCNSKMRSHLVCTILCYLLSHWSQVLHLSHMLHLSHLSHVASGNSIRASISQHFISTKHQNKETKNDESNNENAIKQKINMVSKIFTGDKLVKKREILLHH